MRWIFVIFYFTINSLSVNAQIKSSPFQRVVVPDSIFLKLEDAYNRNAKNVNAGRNVMNLSNNKHFHFEDGIYSFQGQGAHYPKRIFVFNKNKLFVFEKEGAFDPKGVLNNFLECIDELKLNNSQVVRYSLIISNYLKSEEKLTYGQEVKN